MLLPWVDSRGALTGCGFKNVLENHRWQNISGSSPQFCSQPGWPQGAQSTRDINLTPALPLHHFQSKAFKFEKEPLFFANLNKLVVHYCCNNHCCSSTSGCPSSWVDEMEPEIAKNEASQPLPGHLGISYINAILYESEDV